MGAKPKVKLTKEQKIQLRKAKKLLAKQRKEEKIRQVKRDHLSRELEYCRLNREKYEKAWRNTLLDIHNKNLQILYQFYVNNSERILDSKDMEISILLDELDVAKEQCEFNLKRYIRNFDSIVDALDQRLNHIKDEYDKELNLIFTTAKNETDFQNKLNSERELNMKMMLFGLEKQRQIYHDCTKSNYLSRIKEEEDKSIADIEIKQSILEHKFENLWKAYKHTILEYKIENDDTRKQYETLYVQDTFMRKWIKEQTQQLFKAYDKIYQLKFEQSQEKDSIDLKLKSKMNEHKFFTTGFHALKQRLKNDLETDSDQSKSVVKYCNESIKQLKELRNKGEKILKLNAICRKFETTEELIMHFPQFEPRDNTIAGKAGSEHMKLYREKKMLEMFLQRCGQGDALRNILYEEQEHYKIRNVELKRIILNHCAQSDYSCANMEKKDKKNGYLCVKDIQRT